uniref:D-beta-hydroxybutyrate dehydrogenase, mitochondrial n=1 Tax=Sarcophilus harrisii TaxID=9305 RepID=A0A7N4NXE9_SARHA
MLAPPFSRALGALARSRLGSRNALDVTRPGQVLSSLHSKGDEKTQEPREKMSLNKAVLVTGCDSGFGLSIAKHLHALGFTVFAGCLLKDKGKEGSQELDAMNCDRMKTIQLDVCKCAEVNKAIETIQNHLKEPSKGLWGLVNNAGVSTFGEVEFTSLETYKEVAEVNLWGTIRTTKASLPLLRRAKGERGSGAAAPKPPSSPPGPGAPASAPPSWDSGWTRAPRCQAWGGHPGTHGGLSEPPAELRAGGPSPPTQGGRSSPVLPRARLGLPHGPSWGPRASPQAFSGLPKPPLRPSQALSGSEDPGA